MQETNRSHLDLQLEKWRANCPWVSLALMYQQMSCEEMRKEFGSSFYVSETEKTFPIAYMLVVYDSPGQILRLLKSIYRPHNLYCIHPDARQGRKFREFFDNIANCLDNVFVVSQQIKIYYEHISITDAQLNCMRDLEKYPEPRWKYVINLCGKEVPLKTNREIVEYLQMLKGYSAVNAYPLPEVHRRQRITYKFHLDGHGHNRQTWEKQATPPTSVPLYKSANFIAASRAFTHFLLHDPRSRELYDYLISVRDPEEIFYASLYALPSAVGARAPTKVMDKSDVPTVDAFIWVTDSTEKKYSHIICPGQKIVHDICILTALEMQRIEKSVVTKHVFFFNKYYLEWDPTPMDCMEERLVETNIEEYKRDCLPQHWQEKAPYGC